MGKLQEYSCIWRTENISALAGELKIRGGTMFGGIIYNSQSYFVGHNSEKRLHDIQNYIHRNVTGDSPYFPDFHYTSRIYSYSGGYHPYYLFY